MTILAIETATAACSVAILDGGGIAVAAAHEVVGRGHAERLVPMVAALIEGRDPPRAILVDCGPGSFTGVRVGLAAARGFGLAWSVPVTGFSSLGLIAAMARTPEPLAVAMPGGHGELFVQRFQDGLPIAPLRSLRPEDAAESIPESRVYGGGASALVAARGMGEATDLLPDAALVLLLAESERRLPARPIYGRAPDAKVAAPKTAVR